MPSAVALAFPRADIRARGRDAVQSLYLAPPGADFRGSLRDLLSRRHRGARTAEALPGAAALKMLQLIARTAPLNENVAVDSQR